VADPVSGSAHVDTYILDRLPGPELWPEMRWFGQGEPRYPERFNAASVLLDSWIDTGHGERTVLRHSSGPWTYERLYETANRIAHVLVNDCGLVPGGRVLLRSPNHPMLVACWLAVLKAGGIAVSTMPLLRVRELTEIIDKAGITLALSHADVAADLEAALKPRAMAQLVQFNSRGERSLESLMANRSPRFTNVSTAANDPAIIAFTSGTTGRSKGTVHFHRDLITATDAYARHILQPSEDDIFIGSPPLAFTYALGGLVLFPMRFGASSVMLEQVTPPLLLEGIEKYRATIVFTSPTGYRAMLPEVRKFDVSSLRKCVSAGETLPASTFNAWLETVGIRLMDGIGSTELLHMFIGCAAEDARPGSTGRVIPGYRAIVVDHQGKEVSNGTVGRLAVSGPTGCRYLDDLENQRKYVQQGWNLTGDAYHVDEGGYFWYQSRTDDMIVTSGYNVSGPEVENVLLTHKAVAECAVVGVADEARGQLVKAFVVASAGVSGSDALVKELRDYVKSQLAPYKYPRAIEFVSELPRTLTGKIQRYRLRTAAADTPGALTFHEPEGWARPRGYANAVSASGRTVFVAGQVGWNPATGEFPSDDFADQVRQALINVVVALAAAGARPDQITRMTWYITDRAAYLASRRAIGTHYREIVGRHFPAMSVVVVSGLLHPRAKVEIEATAVC
jgi:2-aminobenzoate-CoA ligase